MKLDELKSELSHQICNGPDNECTHCIAISQAVDYLAKNGYLALAGKPKDGGAYRTALEKIDAIRNSIIGYQNVNWSAHIYPLVAALDEAGFPGMGYDEASKLAKTQIDRIEELEAQVAALTADNTKGGD